MSIRRLQRWGKGSWQCAPPHSRATGADLRLESLEERMLLTSGPQLISIQPNVGELLLEGSTRSIAPRELVFRFDAEQGIDASSLSGIQLKRPGLDGIFGNGDDISVAATREKGPLGNDVILRFGSTLPDDRYRIEINSNFRSADGTPFDADPVAPGLQALTRDFRLDLGTQVSAVVPQPITRDANGDLVQAYDQIEIYFDDDELDVQLAESPQYYQLILTNDTVSSTDDTTFHPIDVDFDPTLAKAVLTFERPLHLLPIPDPLPLPPPTEIDFETWTYRLRVGTAEAAPLEPHVHPSPPTDPGDSFETAFDLAQLGAQSQIIVSQIETKPFPLDFPGAVSEPGHRDPEFGNHLPGLADPVDGVTVIAYNFQSTYGQGHTNLITEPQKQRAREAFEIYGALLGIDVVETTSSGLTIATGDPRFGGSSEEIVLDNALDWNDEFMARSRQGQPSYFEAIVDGIGRALGVASFTELPPDTLNGDIRFLENPIESILPSDATIVHGRHTYRPDSIDIDLYEFEITGDRSGLFSAEIFAERLSDVSLLDSVLRLYKETGSGMQLVAQNDDYYSEDAFLQLELEPGRYFIGVSSTGNDNYDPSVPGTGFGGTSQGDYELRLDFRPEITDSLKDTSGVALDGDGDGVPGGVFNFWFRTTAPSGEIPGDPRIHFLNRVIYVDKTDTTPDTQANVGTLANPYHDIHDALNLDQNGLPKTGPAFDPHAARPGDIVRIVGNGASPQSSVPYKIGLDSLTNQPLEDGAKLDIPGDVTVMIDAGAVVKLRRNGIFVGSTAVAVDHSKAALQVLGTPQSSVVFTSINDFVGSSSRRGDWGGILFAGALDQAEGRERYEDLGIFLNHVGHAQIRFGGGIVNVGSVPQEIAPIDIRDDRPAVKFNTITTNNVAAISATPDSFEETNFHSPQFQTIRFTSDYARVGPDIQDNVLANNTINGLFIRIETLAGAELQKQTVSGRWDDADIVHVLSEVLEIRGTPGGPSDFVTARPDARLAIDPSIIVKLDGARIETGVGAQLIAEGLDGQEIVFTSIQDDRFGASGSFDTSNNGASVTAAPGDWGGIYVGHSSTASIDHAFVAMAGGVSAVEGSFVGFNAVEIHQAKARITNSTFIHNAGGLGGQGSTTREGRGTHASAIIFVRGAQPIIVGNAFLSSGTTDPDAIVPATSANDLVPAISINANVLNYVDLTDYGRSTGLVSQYAGAQGNQGPLIRDNRLEDNDVNGMVVRGETLTTEGVWDDTDIVHVLFDNVHVPDFHTYGGLRLESNATESLVVKLGGNSRLAGFDATGQALEIEDRIGGSLHIIGQPGRPVILTSIADQTVGAGKQLDGSFQNQTLRPGFGVPADEIPTGSFKINLHYSSEVEANPVLVAGLEEAARFWEELLADDITIGIDVVIEETGSDPFASAGPDGVGFPYDQVVARMQQDAQGDELDLLSRLPSFSQLTVQGATGPVTVSDSVSLGYPQAKALGYVEGVDFPALPSTTKVGATRDGQINVTALYQRGFTVDQYVPTMIHEMGHILGFTSGVPDDGNFTGGTLTTLDLFRLAPGAGASNFTTSPRMLDPTREQVFYDGGFFDPTGIDIPGLTKGDIPLARGDEPHPDDAQPSHWRPAFALGMNGINVGIMAYGGEQKIRANDLRALGLMGYDLPQFVLPAEVAPGQWRGIQLDELTNDRNVDVITELESSASGAQAANNIPDRAEFLGALATQEFGGDENLRLGFEVLGFLNTTSDVDVYSFEGIAGTEVWLDIDHTSSSLDTVVELIDVNAGTLARSNDSLALDQFSPTGTVTTGGLSKTGFYPSDHFSVNPKDAGMRLTLPGPAGTRGTYFIRVRSSSDNLADTGGGETKGGYQLNIRLREVDEVPGTVVKFADIRYARNGVEVLGMVGHSPLQTEYVEPGDIADFDVALNIGDTYSTERGEISVSGRLEPIDFDDDGNLISGVDWYQFSVGSNVPGISIDVDYADGTGNPNVHVSVYRVGISEGPTDDEDDDYAIYDLIYFGDVSDIDLDQQFNLEGGSFGVEDPFIGPVYPNIAFDAEDFDEVLENGEVRAITPTNQYLLAVSSEALRPHELFDQFLKANADDKDARILPPEFVHRTQFDLLAAERPFTLNDMTMFVTTDGGTTLSTINPFTGEVLQQAPRPLVDGSLNPYLVGALGMRPDGSLYSLSLGTADDDSGNFLKIDWAARIDSDGNPLPENTENVGDDEIVTYTQVPPDDPMDPPMIEELNDGIQFLGMAFTDSVLYAVGNRGAASSPDLMGPDYVENIVYAINGYPQEVNGIDAPLGAGLPLQPRREPDLMGMPPMDGAYTDVFEAGVFDTSVGSGGLIQGLAVFDGLLYGISDRGGFYSLQLSGPGSPGTTSFIGNIATGANRIFTGLTLGPQNLEGGSFADTFFAINSVGRLFAFDATGAPRNVFANGMNRILTGAVAPTGLDFSTLDRNLWEPAGGSITFTAPTPSSPLDAFFTGNESAFAQFNRDYNYPGGAHGVFTLDLDLSQNAGSLVTPGDNPYLYFQYILQTENEFTNEARDGGACDDYQYIGCDPETSRDFHRDALRVYATVAPNPTADDWTLLATNNSATIYDEDGNPDRRAVPNEYGTSRFGLVQELFDNTHLFNDPADSPQGRQARISLAPFAGQPEVTLRFEFSTEASFNEDLIGDAFGDYLRVEERNPDGLTDNQIDPDRNQNFLGVTLNNIFVAYAERGEQFNHTITEEFKPRFIEHVASRGGIEVGNYQLYIRPAFHDTFPLLYETNEIFGRNEVDSLGFGDTNRFRDQGQLVLHSNRISDSAEYGIRFESSPRLETGAANLLAENTARLVRGPVAENNLIVNSGIGGILFAGDAGGLGAVRFGRLINNTIVGSVDAPAGVGIEVGPHASPTLLNNIIAHTQNALTVHSSSTSTVISGQLLYNNASNGPLGDFAIISTGNPFRDAENGNFLLADGAVAIDSAINSQEDRPGITSIIASLGLPALSPILAPDRDGLGQLRIDDPNVESPPGLGSNVIKDRGAFERADDTGPRAEMLTPVDNSESDLDDALNSIKTIGQTFSFFEIRLFDLDISGNDLYGVGINDATVTAGAISVRRDNQLLELGTDYDLSYDSTNDILRLIPLAGLWVPAVYDVKLEATITDLAGNPLAANNPDGTTRFQISVDATDFGDAPDPLYPTFAASNGAQHLILAGFHLGATIDSDSDGQPTVMADGDGDDEDGVVFAESTLAHRSATGVTVTASAAGFLDAWIDFNADGDWDDAGEQVFTSQPLSEGDNALAVTVPEGSFDGDTFARFRFSSTGGLAPTGLANDGEVEDYLVTLVDLGIDYGDAPEPYPTLVADDGAGHKIVRGLFLGASVDGEEDGQPLVGDGDDEDGIDFQSPLEHRGTVVITATASANGFLDAWLDLNDDGDWDDPGEQIFASESLAAGANELSFLVPDNSATGQVAARFRFSSTGGLAPTGLAEDGEVEDYVVTLVDPGFDFGDAPAPYPTLAGSDGARHEILPGFFLGSAVDGEPDGQPTDGADGDGSDEDGVVFTSNVVTNRDVTLTVTASMAGRLDAWFDFNADGDWDDAGEQIFADVALLGGANNLSFFVPGSALAGNSLVRFRYSSVGGLDVTGPAPDGEVEDYRVTLRTPGFDFGDAPAPYPTILASGGARHEVVPGIFLGSTIDEDVDGQPSALADGDGSDEDGVSIPAVLASDSLQSISVIASTSGFLNAWLDFNGDGDWTDAGEQIFTNLALVAGTNFVSFSVPADAESGTTYARFRFSTVSGLGPAGLASDGEVEDYLVTIDTPFDSWHNAADPTNVNNVDGTTALDALLVINELTDREFSDPVTGKLVLPASPPPFFDVNNDTFVSPVDAVRVINALPSSSPIPPAGGGASGVATDDPLGFLGAAPRAAASATATSGVNRRSTRAGAEDRPSAAEHRTVDVALRRYPEGSRSTADRISEIRAQRETDEQALFDDVLASW